MLRLSNGSEHKLHGGMGVLRLRSVAGGGADNMVDACGLRSGDVFIDATAGPLSHQAGCYYGPEGCAALSRERHGLQVPINTPPDP